MPFFIAFSIILYVLGTKIMSKNKDQLILAQTLYGEARGEGDKGMSAVANVIINRFNSGYRGASSVSEVCLDPWQFSTWNANDPNREKIANLLPGDNPVFDAAYAIAGTAISGNLPDMTGGARHYKAAWASAYWADESKVSANIGGHVFYQGIA